MKFHHIGIACRDIEEEIRNISRIHTVIGRSPVVFDQQQEATLALLTLADGTRIELIMGKPVETLLKKGIGYYHLCFEVEDLDAEIARLTGENALLLSPPKPAVLFDHRQVAFLQVSYGMVELLSQKKD
jgi:catechol 2,3-dioxygenase-like lactoylglutathione lyase family enzyme